MREAPSKKISLREDLSLSILSLLAYLLIRLYVATIRKTYINAESYRRRYERDEGMIIAFWHNQLLTMPLFYFGRRFGLSTLISLSKDGELASRIVRRWGIRTVRGSSHRGGIAALKEMLRLSKDSCHHIALTPDGPKGPPFVVKDGPLILAVRSGRSITPLAVAYQRYAQMKSWDGFLLPFPFTKAYFVCGDPVHITEEDNPEGLDRARARLTAALHETNALAMSMRIAKGIRTS
jgi:hypothetical protein